jgi:hypothetical protein
MIRWAGLTGGATPTTTNRATLAGALRKNFYFAMAVTIAAIVVYGFAQTFGPNLEHPAYPRPWILYVHAAVFVLWILLFLTQTGFVRSGKTQYHRGLGPFIFCLAAFLPVIAIETAVVMDRLHALHHEQPDFFPAFFVVHVNDEAAFIVLVGLAALLRRKTPFHSRLMFVSTCILTDAAFSRFPALQYRPFAITLLAAYACADALILCGVIRDVLVEKSVHTVYRFALPALVVGQGLTVALFATAPPWLLIASHWVIGA